MADPSPDLDGFCLATRKIVMYTDLNSARRLFGGRLLSWIDEAAAMAAMKMMRTQNLVTKKLSEVVFDAPALPGDLVEIWSKPGREGRTSLTLDCRVVVRGVESDSVRQICSCALVYVAIDEAGRPRPWRGE